MTKDLSQNSAGSQEENLPSPVENENKENNGTLFSIVSGLSNAASNLALTASSIRQNLANTANTARSAIIVASNSKSAYQASSEIYYLSEDLYNLTLQEVPQALKLVESVSRRLSEFLPMNGNQEGIVPQILYASQACATFATNPALLFFTSKTISKSLSDKANGPVSSLVTSAIHSAKGKASIALDLVDIFYGARSIYKLYNDLNNIQASLKICLNVLSTSTNEILYQTGKQDKVDEVVSSLKEFWNAESSFTFNNFKELLTTYLDNISDFSQIIEKISQELEPFRLAFYEELTRREQNQLSQLEETSILLSNACCNTLVKELKLHSKSLGKNIGSSIEGIAFNYLKQHGAKTALEASSIAITGMTFPITIAILASVITDQAKREALLNYANSLIDQNNLIKDSADHAYQKIVKAQIELLKNEKISSVFNAASTAQGLAGNTIDKIRSAAQKITGIAVGNITEDLIPILIEDAGALNYLQQQLYSFIYQTLDQILKPSLRIVEIDKKSGNEVDNLSSEIYAMKPQLMGNLKLPYIVQTTLTTMAKDPNICAAPQVAVSLKGKFIQSFAHATQFLIKENIEVAKVIYQDGRSLAALASSGSNDNSLDFDNLGSTHNKLEKSFNYERESKKQQNLEANQNQRKLDKALKEEKENKTPVIMHFNSDNFEHKNDHEYNLEFGELSPEELSFNLNYKDHFKSDKEVLPKENSSSSLSSSENQEFSESKNNDLTPRHSQSHSSDDKNGSQNSGGLTEDEQFLVDIEKATQLSLASHTLIREQSTEKDKSLEIAQNSLKPDLPSDKEDKETPHLMVAPPLIRSNKAQNLKGTHNYQESLKKSLIQDYGCKFIIKFCDYIITNEDNSEKLDKEIKSFIKKLSKEFVLKKFMPGKTILGKLNEHLEKGNDNNLGYKIDRLLDFLLPIDVFLDEMIENRKVDDPLKKAITLSIDMSAKIKIKLAENEPSNTLQPKLGEKLKEDQRNK